MYNMIRVRMRGARTASKEVLTVDMMLCRLEISLVWIVVYTTQTDWLPYCPAKRHGAQYAIIIADVGATLNSTLYY